MESTARASVIVLPKEVFLSFFLCLTFVSLIESYSNGGGGYRYGNKANDGYDGGGEQGIDAAIDSKHSIETYSVQTNSDLKTPVVDIDSGPLSLKIRFNSYSSNIMAIQNHFGSHGQVKKSNSIDQPDILIHSVRKPVIQEIKEIITPYRKRIQEIKPVMEKVETIIATGHPGGYRGGDGESSDNGSGGSNGKY